MARGSRESHWLVVRRCLAIIRQLQHSPTDWRGLAQAVLQTEGEDAYGQTEGRTLLKRIHNDLERIRKSLHLDIRANRSTGQYSIYHAERPLLDLPEADLATIAWLEETFDANSPRRQEVRTLLDRLLFFLSPERRLQVEQHRTALVVDLGQKDQDRIDPDVVEGLQTALATRRRVEFDYLSPKYPNGQSRRHEVDIYEPYYFDTVRGHYYLRGWCHRVDGKSGRGNQKREYTHYRVGRISNLQLLPQKLPPSPPPPRRYEVVYRLSANVVVSGVTQRQWIDIQAIEPTEDGGVIVQGTTENIFWAVQELMHYQDMCEVLGGPEMRRRMKKVTQRMGRLYQD